MDFFAAATPCNPLGRDAQNDNALPFLQVDFFVAAIPCNPLGRLLQRLKMTKSLSLCLALSK